MQWRHGDPIGVPLIGSLVQRIWSSLHVSELTAVRVSGEWGSGS